MVTTQQTQTYTRKLTMAVSFLVFGLAIILVYRALRISVDEGGTAAHILTNSSTALPEVAWGRPALATQVSDPTFQTLITRVTGDGGTPIAGLAGTWGSTSRHHYAKDQAWNADQSLIAINNGGGSPSQVYLNGSNYAPRYVTCVDNDGTGPRRAYRQGDDRWHPLLAHRNERINVTNDWITYNGRSYDIWVVEWFDVTTCQRTRIYRNPGDGLPSATGLIKTPLDGYLGPWEGNTSADGRYIALSENNPDTGTYKVFVLDMDPQAPLNPYPAAYSGQVYDLSQCGLSSGCRVDWVSMSPSGRYLVVSYDGDHLRIFDVNTDPANPSTYLSITPHDLRLPGWTPFECGPLTERDPAKGFMYDLGHADITRNPYMSGNPEVIVGQRRSGCTQSVDNNGQEIGSVVMVRLTDGFVQTVSSKTNESSSHHISARNTNRPGWVFVTYHYKLASTRKYRDEMVAMRLDGGVVEDWGLRRSLYEKDQLGTGQPAAGCYDCESHAAPSPDGRRLIFASNWAIHCNQTPTLCGAPSEVHSYVIDTRHLLR